MSDQLSLFPELDVVIEDASKTGTFEDNMKLPIHRWYRYTAGFSAEWVGALIEEEKANGRTHIIDPFVGSGTVAVESALHGVEAFGIESNPYVFKIAKAKLQWRDMELNHLQSLISETIRYAKSIEGEVYEHPGLINRCFPDETLLKLDALKSACLRIEDERDKNFIWFIITSILRSTSPVGTAQWQYVQPNKSKTRVLEPYDAFKTKASEILIDIKTAKKIESDSVVKVLKEDARSINNSIPDGWADLVITSPPYANNYDYADAMRLEMLFWGDICGYDGLKNIRKNLVRACTQHCGSLKDEAEKMLNSDQLLPIKDEILGKFHLLADERKKHGGKKNYHLMIAAYFYDLSNVFMALNRTTSENCKMCFVIGDSAPYGIYIPVEDWLGRLAVNAGFREFYFEKLRDRNTKWKNRKHNVPLKEGRLWINK